MDLDLSREAKQMRSQGLDPFRAAAEAVALRAAANVTSDPEPVHSCLLFSVRSSSSSFILFHSRCEVVVDPCLQGGHRGAEGQELGVGFC